MNKIVKYLAITGLILSLFTCAYDTDYRSADYPEQVIYLPAAGQFNIDDIARKIGDLPFPGYPYRYVVDVSKNEFRIPLSVYRAGVNNKGAFKVDIKVNPDIVYAINEEREDPFTLLPTDKFSIVNSVEMKDGEEIATFDLIVNLSFLEENVPDGIFAVGIEISSAQRETNPDLSAVAVVIHTKIMIPTADFMVLPDNTNGRRVLFRSASTMAAMYQWDFGDGTSSDEESPTHLYSFDGLVTVNLTVTGITGLTDMKTETFRVSELPPTLAELFSDVGGLRGLWEFDDPDNLEKPTVGNPLVSYVMPNSDNVLGTPSRDGIRPVAGFNSTDGAVEVDLLYHFLCDHGIPASSDSPGFVGEYTLVYDLRIPSPGSQDSWYKWIPIFVARANNSGGNNIMVHYGGGGFYVNFGFNEIIGPDGLGINLQTWYRLIFIFESQGFRAYVNGEKVLDWVNTQPSNNTYKLDVNGICILGSATWWTNELVQASTFAIYDKALTDKQVTSISSGF